jgi:DNA-binding response OmpR family regulator
VRVLLVEDDVDVLEATTRGLRTAHLAVDAATTVSAASELLAVHEYDVVVLDLGLPDGDGIDLCRRARTDPQLRTPGRILLLTARDAVADRVRGLDAGADDYLVKPLALVELLARLRALTRRIDQPLPLVRLGDLELDLIRHVAQRAGRHLPLTGKEFALLRYFVSHPDQVLSAESLLEHCWDAHADPFTTSVRVILSRLRRKLGEPQLIHTVTGVGYRLQPV